MVGMAATRSRGEVDVIPARDRLIVALDLSTASDANRIIDELGDTVSFYKIGLHLQLDPELRGLFSRLREENKGIFLDFKFIDIPATIQGGVRAASVLGIKFITVMAQRHIVESAVKAKGNSDLKILAVTLLTGMTEDDMRREYQTNLSLEEFITIRAREASSMGCDGVIASPNEVKLIRSVIDRNNFLVVTPGIRPEGSKPDDQKRTATPYDAIINGADYLVVGRPIIQMQDKRKAAQRIIDEMAEGLKCRETLSQAAPRSISAEIY